LLSFVVHVAKGLVVALPLDISVKVLCYELRKVIALRQQIVHAQFADLVVHFWVSVNQRNVFFTT
jgi:hypothetical protein